jgi:hypothetical protein
MGAAVLTSLIMIPNSSATVPAFHDEDAAVGVQVAALAQAGAEVKDYTRIRELLAEPGVTVLDLQAGQWEQVARRWA